MIGMLAGYGAIWGPELTPPGARRMDFDRNCFNVAGPIGLWINHIRCRCVVDTLNGLSLKADDIGLRFVAPIPDTVFGRAVLRDVRNGQLSGCSCGFRRGRVRSTRVTRGAVLQEISLTTRPASRATKVVVCRENPQPFNRRVDDQLRIQELDHLGDPESLSELRGQRVLNRIAAWSE